MSIIKRSLAVITIAAMFIVAAVRAEEGARTGDPDVGKMTAKEDRRPA